jgi:Uma2 family endonuclease
VVVSRAEEEIPVSAALAHPIGQHTIEDWLALDPPEDGSRIELIWGYFHVSPAPMGQHQVAVLQLSILINEALRRAGRTDLHVVPGVAVEISTALRTGLIPDVVVLDTRPIGVSFRAKNVLMAVEVWSGGNKRSERESKIAAYAAAGVTHFWALSQDKFSGISVTAYRLENDRYVEEMTARPGETVTIKAAPEPVTFDPVVLSP